MYENHNYFAVLRLHHHGLKSTFLEHALGREDAKFFKFRKDRGHFDPLSLPKFKSNSSRTLSNKNLASPPHLLQKFSCWLLQSKFGLTGFIRSLSFRSKSNWQPSSKGVASFRWMPPTMHSAVCYGVLECAYFYPRRRVQNLEAQDPLPRHQLWMPHTGRDTPTHQNNIFEKISISQKIYSFNFRIIVITPSIILID